MPLSFMGIHEHSLDGKGRVIIPAKFRNKINPEEDGEGFVVTPGESECLFVYTPRIWEELSEEMMGARRGSPASLEFQRMWFGRAEEVGLDKQGRVLVPERLLQDVAIEKGTDIVIAGCKDHLEIWEKEAWHVRETAGRKEFDARLEQSLQGVAPEKADN